MHIFTLSDPYSLLLSSVGLREWEGSQRQSWRQWVGADRIEERQSPREWGKEEEERDRDPMKAMVMVSVTLLPPKAMQLT